ncbi:MAG: hypothetical protein H6745_03930 [Deltaproteobacteria bacterium]|nr:hypothetical protein [Deltaproteobacteria bacterium]
MHSPASPEACAPRAASAPCVVESMPAVAAAAPAVAPTCEYAVASAVSCPLRAMWLAATSPGDDAPAGGVPSGGACCPPCGSWPPCFSA